MRLAGKTIKIGLAAAAAACCVCAAPPPPGSMAWEKPIAPGLIFRSEVDYANHQTVFGLRLSLQNAALRPVVALAGGKTFKEGSSTSRLPLSRIISEEGALAGVNGDFFSLVSAPSGDPLGLTVRDGKLLSTPSKRVAFGWGPVEAKMSKPSFDASVQTKTASVKIDGINRRCPNNEITLDTIDAGQALSNGPSVQVRIRLSNAVWSPSTVIRGRIINVSAEPESKAIGQNEAVLIGRGSKADVLNELRAGSECYLRLKTGGFDWERIDCVVGGGPALVQEGEIAIDASEEGFGKEFSDSKHPRTAIGRTAQNDIWLVAVDGRQETGDGVTLLELARLMRRLGCVEAMNLDGGGSTTMNVLGVTVNRPSDGKERAIADAVVIIGSKPTPTSDRVKISAPADLAKGSAEKAKVLDEGTPVSDINVIWGANGACSVDGGGNLQALQEGVGTIFAYYRGHVLSRNIAVHLRSR